MKLKELKPVLSAIRVNLFLEFQKPVKFESVDEGEYMPVGITQVPSMYDIYGEYEVEQIYSGDNDTVNIDLVN